MMLLTTGFAVAHGDEDVHDEPTINVLEIRDQNIRVATAAVGFLIFLVMLAIWWAGDNENAKKGIFILMVITVLLPTIYFVVSTLRVNFASPYGGPVHWHADFKIFACGTELDPPIPEGRFSNKTGTSVLHEHEDRRMHVEGVVVDDNEISLSNFFGSSVGELVGGRFKAPTGAQSFIEYSDGDTCSNSEQGVWNVFLYETGGTDIAHQRKLSIDEYPDYVLSPYQEAPPGDCIIFEFGPEKDVTQQICDFYQIAIDKGNLKIAE